jgi:hypothetical protein
MGWWARYLATFEDNLRHGAGDGVQSALTGKSVSEVTRQRRGEERKPLNKDALRAYILEKQAEFDAKTSAERARGNKNLPERTIGETYIDGVPIVIKFNERGELGRIDVYYGGPNPNPLSAPDEDCHGHIVIRAGKVTSWLEPGPRPTRNKLI